MWMKFRVRDFTFSRFDSKQRDRVIEGIYSIDESILKLVHVQCIKRNSGFIDVAFDKVIYVRVVFCLHFNHFFGSMICFVNEVFKMSHTDRTCLQVNKLV